VMDYTCCGNYKKNIHAENTEYFVLSNAAGYSGCVFTAIRNN
jgi:hypothetical protein